MGSNKTATVTVTAYAGPGLTATSQVFVGALSVSFLIGRNTFVVFDQNNTPFNFDYNATSTVTYVISGNNATITVSQ